jgi:predicted O-methyltransferase YrrM
MNTDFSEGMSIPGYMQEYLEEKVYKIQPKCALEFGTGHGVATKILARYSDFVVTHEMHSDFIEMTKQKLEKYDNIEYRHGYIEYYADKYEYDFVFVDGPKGCLNRTVPFLYHWGHIKSGSYCLFDDANQTAIRALFEYLKKVYKIEYNIIGSERGIGEFIKP